MNKKTLKEIKFFLIVLALLIIADLLFLFYHFHIEKLLTEHIFWM